MPPPRPGSFRTKTVDSPARLTQPLLFLPFRWASFAEGTKKLLKLRRTGKRMKTVGTGSRKTSDPLPHPVTWPSRSPVVPIFVSSIFGRKNLLQIFRRPHDAVLVLILSSPGGNLRQPLRMSLSWGAREVGTPCEWRGGARHCSRAMVGESGLETC